MGSEIMGKIILFGKTYPCPRKKKKRIKFLDKKRIESADMVGEAMRELLMSKN